MARRPIRISLPTRAELMEQTQPSEPTAPEEVLLPMPQILDAGVRKFREMANLHWPGGKDGYKSVSFDTRDSTMLRITIGLVYMAMMEAAKEASSEAPADEGSSLPS